MLLRLSCCFCVMWNKYKDNLCPLVTECSVNNSIIVQQYLTYSYPPSKVFPIFLTTSRCKVLMYFRIKCLEENTSSESWKPGSWFSCCCIWVLGRKDRKSLLLVVRKLLSFPKGTCDFKQTSLLWVCKPGSTGCDLSFLSPKFSHP